tara:strand:- start:4695 stop:6353 length:1659 start_codon:yes stop_codon:yes gene_type:complete
MVDLPPVASVHPRQLVAYDNAGQVPVVQPQGGGELAPLLQAVMQGAQGVGQGMLQGMDPKYMLRQRERALDPVESQSMSNLERLFAILPGLDAVGPGAFARIPAGALGANALRRQASSEAPHLRNSRPDYTGPAGSKPEYLGAAPDRTEWTYLRYPPKKIPARTQNAIDNIRANKGGVKDELIRDIKAGQEVGGSDWYNTEELRDWFIEAHGATEGHKQWAEFMDLMGATSTGNKVPSNIGVASYYRHKGEDWFKDNYDALVSGDLKPIEGYGHKMQSNHATNVARLGADEWVPMPDAKSPASANWTQNPKPKGFSQSLKGSGTNIAADLHFTRYMAMADGSPEWLSTSSEMSQQLADRLTKIYGAKTVNKYITLPNTKKGKPKFNAKKAIKSGDIKFDDIKNEPTVYVGMPADAEYKAFEDLINEIGAELGMTGPQAQANLWMGGAQRTGVDDTSQGTFMQLFRNRADETAKKTGKTRQEVIENFIKNRDLMAVSGPPIYSPLSSDEYTMYEPPEEFSSVPVRPNSYPNYMPPQAPELDANPLSTIPPNMV